YRNALATASVDTSNQIEAKIRPVKEVKALSPYPTVVTDITERTRVTSTLDTPQQITLLQVKHVTNHTTQQNIDKTETHKHKCDGEQFGHFRIGSYVAIPNCTHSHNAKIQSINYRVCLSCLEMIPIQRVYNHTKAQIDDQENNALPHNRRFNELGRLRFRRMIDFVDCGHCRCRFGSVEIALGECVIGIDQPRGLAIRVDINRPIVYIGS
ncbi:50S ribosomal protein L11, partial [Striga asiatica]